MGMILRKGSILTRKKKNEKKITFVFFKDQMLNPVRKKVMPTKLKVLRLIMELETGMVYEAE